MQIELEVWYTIEGNLQESTIFVVDDEVIQFILLRYLNTNKPRSELEDWVINKACFD